MSSADICTPRTLGKRESSTSNHAKQTTATKVARYSERLSETPTAVDFSVLGKIPIKCQSKSVWARLSSPSMYVINDVSDAMSITIAMRCQFSIGSSAKVVLIDSELSGASRREK